MIDLPVPHRILCPRAFLQGSGNGDALENVNPSPLPDGCLCWVIDQAALYWFHKDSMAAVSAPNVIATVYGASHPGRWQLLSTTPVLAYGSLYIAEDDGGSTGVLVQDTFVEAPGAMTLGECLLFSDPLAGGLLRYDGASTRAFLCTAVSTMGAAAGTIRLRIAVNDTTVAASEMESIATSGMLVAQAIVNLDPLDEVKVYCANGGTTDAITDTTLTLTVIPA
jgi:hypothetical protein